MNQAGLFQQNLVLAEVLSDEGVSIADLLRIATTDPKTGIFNIQEIERRGKRSLEQSQSTVLVYIDLDGLKQVNDSRGHREGDKYLKKFVAFCKRNLRATDSFGRIGGDEFLVIMPGTTTEQGELIMARLQEAAEEKGCPFSYGVTDDRQSKDLAELIQLADSLMYQQKRKRKLKQ